MTEVTIYRAGNRVFLAGVTDLVVWVVLLIRLPCFDLAPTSFFLGFLGVLDAQWNLVQIAVATIVRSTGGGAPAGYALPRFDFRARTCFAFWSWWPGPFPPAAFGAATGSADHLCAVFRHPSGAGRGRLDAGLHPVAGLHKVILPLAAPRPRPLVRS